MKKTFALTSLSVALLAFAGAASAGQASGTFKVTAQVQGSCIVSSTEDIQFGTYDPVNLHATSAQNLDAQGKVSVRCTAGSTNVKVALDEGLTKASGSSCATPLRQVKSAKDDVIAYSLYQDTGRATAWGCDASNEANIPSFASSLTPVELVTYGRIAGGQFVPIGTYTDTVGVTVTF